MTKQLTLQRVLAATLLLLLGLYLVSNAKPLIPIPYVGYFALFFFGTIAYTMVFGAQAYKKLFQKPVNFRKNFIKYFLLTILFSFVLGIVLTLITHTQKGNEAVNNSLWFFFLIMPFALIGEELFSIYFYELFKLKAAPLAANILVSIIFGLIHYTTYFNGSVLLTVVQIILIQGSARFWLNKSYEQSQSILTSFAIHYFFDLATFMFTLFITH